VPLESLRSNGRPRIVIAGSTAATDSIAIHDRTDGLWLSAAYASARKAYGQAGIQPEDVDLFELHDAFSIMASTSLEECGFAERGQGPPPCPGWRNLAQLDVFRLPRAVGLKARGHPVGATGVYQIAEIVQQLRERQAKIRFRMPELEWLRHWRNGIEYRHAYSETFVANPDQAIT